MELSRDILRHLYLEELLPEVEIASRYGISQVQVGRLRRKWGIPTLTRAQRVAKQVPEISSEQRSLIVGSLLGDGWMTATSKESARFAETHSADQKAYLDWKVGLLGSYVSSVYETEKRDGEKVYKGWGFATKSCPQLRPYYDLFYPKGSRQFPRSLTDHMGPLVLAVWYMDDGSVTSTGDPRISYGLDDRSLRHAVRALRSLGLKPRVYGEGSNRSIHFPKQGLEFRELVEPHVPECMAYKLPFESPGKATHRRARALEPGQARSLYEGGMSMEQIASLYGVGRSTVHRRLEASGAAKRRPGPKRAEGRLTLHEAHTLLEGYDSVRWAGLGDTEQAEWVSQVVETLRKAPFPAPEPYEPVRARGEFRSLCSDKAALVLDSEGSIAPLRFTGIGMCASFFPNRYKATSRAKRSAYEAWHDDKELRKAVLYQFKVGDPVVPYRVLKAVTMNCRTPTVFRPTVARFLYGRYCKPGGKVWDPCMGYGGRLVGALAAGVQYVGTDVDPETVGGNQRLADTLDAEVELHLCPAEEFTPPPVDMVFTSPPYFAAERYSQEGGQSWKRYSGFDSWVEGFLRPVVRSAAKVLKTGGVLALNVADVKVGRKVVPLVDTTLRVASEEGFVLSEELSMPLAKLNRAVRSEPVLIFMRAPVE